MSQVLLYCKLILVLANDRVEINSMSSIRICSVTDLFPISLTPGLPYEFRSDQQNTDSQIQLLQFPLVSFVIKMSRKSLAGMEGVKRVKL